MSKTYILRWNPEISSWKKEDFEKAYGKGFYDLTIDFPVNMNWSIYEWQDLQPFDKFFMFTTGDDDQAKLVMAGFFSRAPYKFGNWNSKSGKVFVHYADLVCTTAFHPDCEDAITVASLRNEIPDYDFGHGHAGVLLDEKISEKLFSIVAPKRNAALEKAKAGGCYMPRLLPSTLNILKSDERLYLNSASRKLVEGYACDVSDGEYEYEEVYKFVVTPNVSKLWQTFWDLANDAFDGKRFTFFLAVYDYKSLTVTQSSLENLKSILEHYKSILVNDCLVSFGCRGDKGRCVIATTEKEILVNYGRKRATAKYIRSLGFLPCKELCIFSMNDDLLVTRSSVFGDEFDDKLYYELKEKLGAHYMYEEE